MSYPFSLPELGYDYDALEPHIDAKTMEIHHSKHFAGYTNKLNAALEGHEKLQKFTAEQLLWHFDSVPAPVQTALRNNGGGSLQEADALTGLFIKSGPTVQVKAANRQASVYADTDEAVAWEGPMAVLVNRLSASASEIFAGAIQDYGRGIIIGSQTFGKGTVQTLIPLNRGQLKVTAAKFYRISGESTQHQGVHPDIEFPEVFDTDRIGESSLEDAMPWDKIRAAMYPKSQQIAPLMADLKTRHEQRVVNDPDFVYMRALALKNREENDRTLLSLNENVRVAEKEGDDQWRLDLENALRKAKGKEPVASLEDLETQSAQEEEELEDPANDAMLRESGYILIDLIGLSRQVALVDHEAAPGVAIH